MRGARKAVVCAAFPGATGWRKKTWEHHAHRARAGPSPPHPNHFSTRTLLPHTPAAAQTGLFFMSGVDFELPTSLAGGFGEQSPVSRAAQPRGLDQPPPSRKRPRRGLAAAVATRHAPSRVLSRGRARAGHAQPRSAVAGSCQPPNRRRKLPSAACRTLDSGLRRTCS